MEGRPYRFIQESDLTIQNPVDSIEANRRLC